MKPEEFLVEEVTGIKPGRVVDLGAGEGFDSIWLAEQGWDVTAVDFAPTVLKILHEIAVEKGVHTIIAEADILTYQPGHQFDLVYIEYLHVPDYLID